ncbi:MAG TPA: AfsA-related hotdog domain-containing protein [Duganella sp.]|nr:AfsA-related hotdog domain-containing protein [Duganella sp.]
MSYIVVVGDHFKKFASDKQHVLTVSELEREIWQGVAPEGDQIVIGQGVEHDRFVGLVNLMERRRKGGVRVQNMTQILDQCDPLHQRSVHKHKRENVLITRPVAQPDGTYVAQLSIRDSGELLNDHATGQHIQGIVLTEAGRQMLISTSEYHLLDGDDCGSCYFVLNSLNTEFKQFAFPLPVTIVFRALSQARKPGRYLKVDCEISFYQNDLLVAVVRSNYCAYSSQYIDEKESALANTACGGQRQAGAEAPALAA